MSRPIQNRPVIGIIGNSALLNETYAVHAGGTMNSEAVAEVAGALPLIIPADPRFVRVDELLDLCDGFLLTGGRPNVHPSEDGEEDTPAHGADAREEPDDVRPLEVDTADLQLGRREVDLVGGLVLFSHQRNGSVTLARNAALDCWNWLSMPSWVICMPSCQATVMTLLAYEAVAVA